MLLLKQARLSLEYQLEQHNAVLFFPLGLAFLGGAASRGAKDSGLKSEDVEATGALEEADKLSTEPSVAPRAVAKVDVNERTQEFTKAAARLLT